MRALKAEAEFVRADVRNEEDIRALVDKTVALFGRLDAAVNNAGFEGKLGSIQEATGENLKAVHDTNVLGVFLSMKHELPAMAGQGSGSIVNITSTYGHKAGARRDGLRQQQVCRGGHDQIGRARARQFGHSSQCGCARPDGHRYA